MLLLATHMEDQLDADLHPIQNQVHALISYKQGRPVMLTYTLFNTHSMHLSATSRKGQLDANLHTVQNPEHALVSYKLERPAGCQLTTWSKPRACCCQLQVEKASWMLTYTLFNTQSMLLLATSREGQLDADLHSVQHTQHALVSNKQGRPAGC